MNVISPESPGGRPTAAASTSFTENRLKLSPILQAGSMSGRSKKVAVPPARIPFETWRYRYIEGIGNEVILEFVDPTMSGEYRLTSNPDEKDALLHVDGLGLTLDEQMNGGNKGDRITGIGPGAYRGNALGNAPTRNNNQFDRLELMTKVFRPPDIKFKDLETIVTTRLSYNLLPFDFRTDFVRVTEESVLTPITILLQNKDLAFQEKEGIQQAMVHVYGKITGINGRVAQVFEDTISQDIPTALYKQALENASIHQRIVPLRPGLYKLDLVLKDINSGNVGTINTRLAVPRYPDEKAFAEFTDSRRYDRECSVESDCFGLFHSGKFQSSSECQGRIQAGSQT